MQWKHLLFYMSNITCVLLSGMAQAETMQTAPDNLFELKADNGESIIFRSDAKENKTIQLNNCNLTMDFTKNGDLLAVGNFTLAYGPYTTRCTGIHAGEFANLSKTRLSFVLQKKINGVWQTITNATGSGGKSAYNGEGGEYRWLVANLGDSSGKWKIDFKLQL